MALKYHLSLKNYQAHVTTTKLEWLDSKSFWLEWKHACVFIPSKVIRHPSVWTSEVHGQNAIWISTGLIENAPYMEPLSLKFSDMLYSFCTIFRQTVWKAAGNLVVYFQLLTEQNLDIIQVHWKEEQCRACFRGLKLQCDCFLMFGFIIYSCHGRDN